jgi:hypothetical protein
MSSVGVPLCFYPAAEPPYFSPQVFHLLFNQHSAAPDCSVCALLLTQLDNHPFQAFRIPGML